MNCKARPGLLHRPFVVWLVLLIAAFGASAPTVSHALAWSQSGNPAWTEVCTAKGTRWVMMGQVRIAQPPITAAVNAQQFPMDSPTGPESVFSLEHCPFCLLSTDRVVPPPHYLPHLFIVPGGHKVPTVRQVFLFLSRVDWIPPSRGPPIDASRL